MRGRRGQDVRYALASGKVEALGWGVEMSFAKGRACTVDWYRQNPEWWEALRSGEYREYYERQYGRALG